MVDTTSSIIYGPTYQSTNFFVSLLLNTKSFMLNIILFLFFHSLAFFLLLPTCHFIFSYAFLNTTSASSCTLFILSANSVTFSILWQSLVKMTNKPLKVNWSTKYLMEITKELDKKFPINCYPIYTIYRWSILMINNSTLMAMYLLWVHNVYTIKWICHWHVPWCHVTTVMCLFIVQKQKQNKRNIKLRKINKKKRKIFKFQYTITLYSSFSPNISSHPQLFIIICHKWRHFGYWIYLVVYYKLYCY